MNPVSPLMQVAPLRQGYWEHASEGDTACRRVRRDQYGVRVQVTLAKKQCRLDIRNFSFFTKIVNDWNRLSADCVGASSVNIF